MSLHLRLQKDRNLIGDKVKIALSFFNYFKDDIIPRSYRVRSKGELIAIEDFKSELQYTDIMPHVQNDDVVIEFFFKIHNNLAYLEINNGYQSRFAEDIGFNLFDFSLSKLLNNSQIREKVNLFLRNAYHEYNLVKGYVDIDEEGEENPLHIIYDYEPRGSNFFIKVIRALELLAEESSSLMDLFDKIKGSDKNYVANRLWQQQPIREFVFSIAKSKGIVAEEGSMLFFADNNEKVANYYLEIINGVLNPIFSDTPAIDKRIESFSEEIANKN